MTTKRFYRRRFLNKRGFHAGAYVLASCEVDVFAPSGGDPTYTVDAELTVADCARITTLDFCVAARTQHETLCTRRSSCEQSSRSSPSRYRRRSQSGASSGADGTE